MIVSLDNLPVVRLCYVNALINEQTSHHVLLMNAPESVRNDFMDCIQTGLNEYD